VLFLASRAEAEGVCRDPRVTVEGELEARWLASVIEMCESLERLPNVDPTARLRVVPDGQDVVIEVSVADGRRALRKVSSPEDLGLTVEALITLPPLPEPKPIVEKPPPGPTAASERQAPKPQPSRASPDASGIAFEGGVLLAGRISRSPTYTSLGPEGHAGLRAGAWTLGIAARWDAVDTLQDDTYAGFEMEGAAVGVFAAHRVVALSGFALEAGGSALVVSETQSVQAAEGEKAGSATDLRAGILARASFGGGPLVFLTQLDADLSPTRVRKTLRIDEALPPLPAWSAGFGLGVGWVHGP
jgi:hypothetical protein